MPHSTFSIREIKEEDNEDMRDIILTVMESFGAMGEGFSSSDPEIHHLYQAYQKPGHKYFVAFDHNNRMIAGSGIGDLPGADSQICELKKMYCLDECRGKGVGFDLFKQCHNFAKEYGYQFIYLETLSHMHQALEFYQRQGFKKQNGPLGNTGHSGCNEFYLLKL